MNKAGNEFLLTLLSLAFFVVPLAFMWLLGWSALKLLRVGGDPFERWLLAPVFGLAISTFVLETSVRLDLKIGVGVFALGAICAGLTGVAYFRNRRSEVRWPKRWLDVAPVVSCMIAAFVFQGLSYLIIGPEQFVGFATRDMWNYTVLAQSAIDIPYSAPLMDGNSNPLLPLWSTLRELRLGQSVIHGGIAFALGISTKTAWGVAALLGPVMLICPLWLIARDMALAPIVRALVVVLGASLPGLAWIHLENTFLSNAMVLPLLFLWPLLIGKILSQPSISLVIISGVVFFAVTAIYGEVAALLIALSLLTSLWNLCSGPKLKTGLIGSAGLIVAHLMGLVLVPSYTLTTVRLMILPFTVNTGADWPPNGLTIDGLTQLWAGTKPVFMPPDVRRIETIAALLSVLVGVSGALMWFFQRRTALSLAVLAVILLPLVLLSAPTVITYQYYKAVATYSPLIALSIGYVLQHTGDFSSRSGGAIRIGLLTLTVGQLCFASWGAIRTNIDLVNTSMMMYRNSRFIDLTRKLEATRGKNLLIKTEDQEAAPWLAYSGRKNHLWFVNDFYGTSWPLANLSKNKYNMFMDLNTVPKDAETVEFQR